ncbi:M50 family metallopeptidase [Candidatus Woesearchaeota archaeon]|nr:M50 family metallopeptidase [Candidatus Woesearchaeota archaeon]
MNFVLYNILDKIKRYYNFTRLEARNLIITILILGFIVGFNDGTPNSTFTYWITNMFNSILIVALAVLVHESAHRVIALIGGYRAEYRVWWYGLMFGLILTIVSRGKIWFLLPGGFIVDILQRHRLGHFRYGINYWIVGIIAFMGALANLLLAMIFKILMYIPYFQGNPLLEKVVLVNVIYAIMSLLPLPGLGGINLLYASRITYFSLYPALIAAGLLTIYANVFIAVISFIIVGILAWIIFFFSYEADSYGE